jgi:flagellar biosynthesis/type III secretory pathway chaperone
MIEESLSQKLADQLRISVEYLAELDKILSLESVLLRKHDTEGLVKIVDEKMAVLKNLEECGSFLRELFEAGLLGQWQAENWNRFEGQDSQGLWRDFQRLLLSCNSSNQVNGRLIRWNSASLESLLDVIRGNSEGNIHYAPTGKIKPAGENYLVAMV